MSRIESANTEYMVANELPGSDRRFSRHPIIYTTAIVRKIVWLILIAALATAGWFAWALLTPVAPSGQVFVMLHPGYSTRRIAAELKANGIIRSEDAFILWHYFRRRRSLKAGEYLFEKPANIIDIQKRLRRGDVYFHTIVVPEGFTMFDIARAIEAAGLGPADDFLKVAQSDTALIADLAPGAQSLEGYLFPDTYQFSRMMSMQEMAAAMVKQFRQVAAQIGLSAPTNAGVEATRDIPLPLQTKVTMASIVEKETAVAEERPLVASVYYNRLAKKGALDADPSIIYAEQLAGTYTGALHHDDMRFNSPYNTYTHAGLPPGPIANPGKSALEAAMHPAQSNYYYFVADAAGHHRFARTIEEHNKNVAAYRRAMRGQ
ncbi:MAG TPA: endolytic transglycosylase MltG [Candidatus Sulfotelmatobacter sp.]|nr:endolytic transglycosylase MltG [Candidatus Sulfotelmatobacter sp.]